MSKKNIWEMLKAKGFSDVAAAAIMGNMEAESNCISYRIQGDFTSGFQKSKDYTGNIDTGIIDRDNFINRGPGGGGYGLCQWTYPARKAGLYDLAKVRSVSIGDEQLQIDWFWEELHQGEFLSVLNTLLDADSIRKCSDALIKRFLRPADQSDAVCVQRAQLGQSFYREFAGGQAEDPDGQPDMIQITEDQYKTYMAAMSLIGYIKDIMEMLEEFQL